MSKELKRGAGILLPMSSIPSNYGIGTMGKAAYKFIDQLVEAGQSFWQVLPVGPTSFGDSPYQSFSAFAGNPYFIDLDILIKEGLLKEADVKSIKWCKNEEFVDYDTIFENRFPVLKKAFKASKHKETKKYAEFIKKNDFWLKDYSLYMAIKEAHGQREWLSWEDDIKFRKPEALSICRTKYKETIDFYMFLQFKFDEQWNKLKKYANNRDISIIGDIPIYVALDSADVWANPELFQLDKDLKPVNVAGCPPDAFSDWGQKWGNPIYDWDKMEENDFDWWKKRISVSSKIYDVIRIDHFIGIVRYYNIPADSEPKKGFYKTGPGLKLVKAIDSVVGTSKVIAEDLGVVVPEVRQLVKESGYPGMKILQFGFDGNPDNEHILHNHEKNYVVYIGTHDNDTLKGYIQNATKENIAFMMKYLSVKKKKNLIPAMIKALYMSVSDTVIVQMQDLLKKDNSARMNLPSTIGTNWRWRLKKGEFSQKIQEELLDLSKTYARYHISEDEAEEK